MKKFLPALTAFIICFFCLRLNVKAQNQTLVNGDSTTAISFPASSCMYAWTNDNPSIGLPATGIGNIPSFGAINKGNTPVKATITSTPVSSGYAYFTNATNNVYVVSTLTHGFAAGIKVGNQPKCASVSPDGTHVYVTNNADNTVSVISCANNTVVATIPVGVAPLEVIVSPDGTKAYVTNTGDGTISVINTASNSVATTIPSLSPQGIAVSPDGKWLYVTNNITKATLSVISTATYLTVASIRVGNNPLAVAVSHDGARVYVTCNASNTVSIINTSTNTVIAAIHVGKSPYGISILPDDSKVFVANSGAGNISVINTAADTIASTFQTLGNPYGLCVSPDGKEIYIAEQGGNQPILFVINAETYATIASETGGVDNPISLGSFVSVGLPCSVTTTVINTITVNPTPGVTASSPTGSIYTCAGTASSGPNIEQFKVIASSLTADVTITAQNYQLSLSPDNGYTNTLILHQVNGKVDTTVIYVRLSAPASETGEQREFIRLTSPGFPDQTVLVDGFAAPLPAANAVSDQTVINGGATTAVNFTGAANTFNWVNDTPGIGLAASGTGNIPSFTAENNTGVPIKATITATPQASGFAYIANTNSNTVSVISVTTKTVVAVIPVGLNPACVAASPDGSKVYVGNGNGQTASVISTLTNSVIATVHLGSNVLCRGIAVSPDNKFVYVLNGNTSGPEAIYVINTATNIATAMNVNIPFPLSAVVSSDGQKLYVTSYTTTSGYLYVIGTGAGNIISKIAVGLYPHGLALSPDGTRAYVTCSSANTVTVINTVSNAIVAVIPGLILPYGIVVSPDGAAAYVVDNDGLGIINTSTNKLVSSTFSYPGYPETGPGTGISITPDGKQVYLEGTNPDAVYIVNTDNTGGGGITNTINGPGALGNFISTAQACPGVPMKFSITVNPSGPYITTSGTLSALDTKAGTASASSSFNVSATGLTTGILVTAPAGFEVSTDNSTFSNTVTVGAAGNITSVPVYVRLTAADAAGTYSGNIALSSAGATNVNVATAVSTVDPVNFTLPTDNFKLTITSATCKGNSDGSIGVTATQSMDYTATITGNGLNTAYPFTTFTAINSLAAGTYHVCITVAGQADYSQCYDAVITEPQDLSVYSTINSDNSLTLALSGGTQYNILLNGQTYNTTASSITLLMTEGNNDLTVTTDRLCQGSYKKLINVSGNIVPYPVPFQTTLNLNVGNTNVNQVNVEIHNVSDGKLVYTKQYVNQSGVVQLDLTDLQAGAYALYLSMDNTDRIFKIIKK